MIFRPHGVLNEKKINSIIGLLEKEEERAQQPFNRFSDFSELDAIDLEFRFILRVALHRRLTYGGRAPVKSAFYTPNKASARVVKVHALVTDQSPLQVQMFDLVSEAAKWLGVLPTDLQLRSR